MQYLQMLIPLALLQVAMLVGSKMFAVTYYQFIVVPLINTIMMLIIICRFGAKYAITRLTCGQILPMYLYTVWLALFPQPEYIYIIPLLLSSIGKTYLMCTSPSYLEIDAAQSLIKLQSKIQIIILFHHVMKCLYFGILSRSIELMILVVVLKLKYTIHYGTRLAYEQIHFGLDRIFKSLGFREFYHLVHRFCSQLGSEWKNSKQITY